MRQFIKENRQAFMVIAMLGCIPVIATTGWVSLVFLILQLTALILQIIASRFEYIDQKRQFEKEVKEIDEWFENKMKELQEKRKGND